MAIWTIVSLAGLVALAMFCLMFGKYPLTAAEVFGALRAFFGGSTASAASALFELPDSQWSRDELTQLSQLVNDALEKEGK